MGTAGYVCVVSELKVHLHSEGPGEAKATTFMQPLIVGHRVSEGQTGTWKERISSGLFAPT